MQSSSGQAYGSEYCGILEWSGFVSTLEKCEEGAATPNLQGDLVIEATPSAVHLGLRWNQSIGQPRRRDKLRALTLPKGRVARFIINGRYTSYSGQYYTEATYNVAFDDDLESDVFLEPATLDVFDMRRTCSEKARCAAQPAVAADLVLAYARSQAAERHGRWADSGHRHHG